MIDYHRRFDVAHLARTELLTPDLDGSLFFFKDLLGMYETERRDGSVYLRCYEDPYRHSLKLTPAKEAGLGALCWRTTSEQALDRRAAAIDATEFFGRWVEGDQGMGRTYEFASPDGHRTELCWEFEEHRASGDEVSVIKTRPSRRPLQGLPPKRLDHINLLATNTSAVRRQYEDQLGFYTTERVIDDITSTTDEVESGVWMTVNNLSHEIAVMQDGLGQRGRLHHISFYYGLPQHNSDMAEICRDYGIRIEVGPDVHGLTQGAFLYVFEPGGNRIELFGNAGILIFQPDFVCRDWRLSDFDSALAIGGATMPAETFFVYGTPGTLAPEGGAAVAERETHPEPTAEVMNA